MEPKIIKTKKQYEETLLWIDEMFDNKLKSNTKQGEQLSITLLAVKKYEDANYPIPLLRKQ